VFPYFYVPLDADISPEAEEAHVVSIWERLESGLAAQDRESRRRVPRTQFIYNMTIHDDLKSIYGYIERPQRFLKIQLLDPKCIPSLLCYKICVRFLLLLVHGCDQIE
jgi:hypothetical protein